MNIQLSNIRDDITLAVKTALQEDIGSGDITAELIPVDKSDKATVITREDCIVCGTAWVDETFHQIDPAVQLHWKVKDGDKAKANSTLVELNGNTRSLLTGERTALNFLQLLSGTATKAHEFKETLGNSHIQLLDTRKTIPGLRTAQKYAVNTGGCHNHRIGLFDAFLIKENHIAGCGGITQAVDKAKELYPGKLVEVEVETIEELKEALNAKVDIVMLDNFSEENLEAAGKLKTAGVKYEVSGNIQRDGLKEYKSHSIDFISLGTLTKHVKAVDLSLRIQ
ncbi:MAG: carboxylating nicotinate-nucleotide diphosphorylase [Agarilytica sp.]